MLVQENARAFEALGKHRFSTMSRKATPSSPTPTPSTPTRTRITYGQRWSVSQNRDAGKVFTLNLNDISLYAPLKKEPPQAGSVRFRSEKELSRLAARWPASRLVEIWNRLPATNPVRKFTDRKTAVERIWKAIQSSSFASKGRAMPGRRKPHRPNKPGSARQKTEVRQPTKTHRIVALLEQPAGATLKAIMAATEWQAHSVRGFISGQLRNRMGLRVKSFELKGERVYAIQK
jgi:hypothetical protein